MNNDLTEAKRILDKIELVRTAFLKKYEMLLKKSKPNNFKNRMAAIFNRTENKKKEKAK